jgi:hypothetical protein
MGLNILPKPALHIKLSRTLVFPRIAHYSRDCFLDFRFQIFIVYSFCFKDFCVKSNVEKVICVFVLWNM